MLIKQIGSPAIDNFSYLIICTQTKKAMVLDPSRHVEQIIEEAKNLGASISCIVNSHGHFDHTSGNTRLKIATGAPVFMHYLDAKPHSEVDVLISEEKTLQVGAVVFEVIHTPGHTPGGICLYAEGNLFTGDTLFVGDSGRTDLPGGDRTELGKSIRNLMQLPDDTIVWPGHDYGPAPYSTLAWERKNNCNAVEYGFYTK